MTRSRSCVLAPPRSFFRRTPRMPRAFSHETCRPFSADRPSRGFRSVTCRRPVMAYKEIRIGSGGLSELLDIPAPWKAVKVEEDKDWEHVRVLFRYDRGSRFAVRSAVSSTSPFATLAGRFGRISGWAAIACFSSPMFRASSASIAGLCASRTFPSRVAGAGRPVGWRS